jgi:hypothetical protein
VRTREGPDTQALTAAEYAILDALDGGILSFERREELVPFLVSQGYRNSRLWAAMDAANRVTTLSSVPEAHRELLIHAKTLTTLLTVIIDDVADRTRDPHLFRDLVRILQRVDDLPIPFVPVHPDAVLAARVWEEVVSILREAPRYEEFLDLWLFDMAELVQCQRYNLVVNENPSLANTPEYLTYGTHNFNVKPHMTMDLMFSPAFRDEDLGAFRRAQQHIQIAIQLVNDKYTLDRELDEERAIASYPIIWCLEEEQLGVAHLRMGGLSNAVLNLSQQALEDLRRGCLQEAARALAGVSSFDVELFFNGLATIEDLYRKAKGRI